MRLLAVVLSLGLTLVAVIVGMAKVQRLPASMQIRDRAHIPSAAWTASGWIELVAAAGLVLGIFAAPGLAVASAAVLFISYLVLAVRQALQRNPAFMVLPAAALAVVSAVTAVVIMLSE